MRSCLHWFDRQKLCCTVTGESIAGPFAPGENPNPGPQFFSAHLVWLDGKNIRFELVMEPLQTLREVTLWCRLAANWDLPQPLYARLDLGDMHWIGPVDPCTHVIGWLAKSREVLDPQNPGRVRGPLKLKIMTIEGVADTNPSGSP